MQICGFKSFIKYDLHNNIMQYMLEIQTNGIFWYQCSEIHEQYMEVYTTAFVFFHVLLPISTRFQLRIMQIIK